MYHYPFSVLMPAGGVVYALENPTDKVFSLQQIEEVGFTIKGVALQ
jgi:hypothetical protein